ncbi:LexA repressor [Philodulcilactobacillus myokoensis]|uniref:LexA repressor n=1 Tax=Philodulcilactobacillus myokoensis TaxID=2929573 RepID=A0A9W6B208_9LACO|nr:transcriptional repressor LexA [Philodulcilactobacillus myokoensis]GLB46963.1 LexA repressor [Philodulcilactobacillus myokoensis]
MENIKPSEKQLQILNFIWKFQKENNYPPTIREICDEFNIYSTATAHGYIKRLIKNKYLLKKPVKNRALDITKLGLETLNVQVESNEMPILGEVAAGMPINAIQNIEGYFPIPFEHQYLKESLFMLKIKGSSMVKAGILDHDYVIVRKQPTAENGEIVIAMTKQNEVTCKRFFKERSYYRLQPENDEMKPIYLYQVTIIGKVISVYRNKVA